MTLFTIKKPYLIRTVWCVVMIQYPPFYPYSISQEICTRFCCALLCCGYAIVHNDSHEVFIHIHQGCFAGTGAIVRLPQCQWSKLDGYGKIRQCITTTKHSKAKTVCIFLGIYCTCIHKSCLKRTWETCDFCSVGKTTFRDMVDFITWAY